MAEVEKKAASQLTQITECPICMNDFTDPRVLPCVHTFCFECLKRTGEEAHMKPGDKMPCPLCRKEFIIPVGGMNGVQKNFFMENLLEFKTTLQLGSNTIVFCDMCNIRNEGRTGEISKATMGCLECQDNYCDSCVKVHQLQKRSRNHHIVKIKNDDKSSMKSGFPVKCCTKHANRPLDFYCSDCKKIVCVSCFVESHTYHNCKDVTTVDEEFRQTIEKKAWLISNYGDELVSRRKNTEKRKADFLKNIVESEKAIHKRNQQLKDMIDRDTKSLLDELSVIKSNHLQKIETEMQEIDRSCTILKSFEAYCNELRLKGSASDICSSVDQLVARADDLERDHETIIARPHHQSVEVYFQAADLLDVSLKSYKNVMGEIHIKGCSSEARAESEKREIEIREHVFSISLPGVEITHCNFGKTKVEVWYIADKSDNKVEEKLQKLIEPHVDPYKLKLVKKFGCPVFKYTSPGQSISLNRPAAGSIGAYVTLKDEDDESVLHALVCGHGKAAGDILCFNDDAGEPIGEVKVAKDHTRKRCIAYSDVENQLTNSIDVGLVLMREQQLNNHMTTVTTNNSERIQLASAEAAIHPRELDDDQKVMVFNSGNRQGAVRYQNYNSRNPQKFGMIGIAQTLGEEMQAVHGMNESGTLVAAWPPYQENGVKLVKAVGMLVGIEEFEPSSESISLAVPIVTNIQELIEDEYCENKEIQFV